MKSCFWAACMAGQHELMPGARPHSPATALTCCPFPRSGGDDDPYVTSFRGLDNPTYYMTDTEQYVQLLNYSGCGNTTNANHPVMQRLIMDSLRMCALNPVPSRPHPRLLACHRHECPAVSSRSIAGVVLCGRAQQSTTIITCLLHRLRIAELCHNARHVHYIHMSRSNHSTP